MSRPRDESTLPKWAQDQLMSLRHQNTALRHENQQLRAGMPNASDCQVWAYNYALDLSTGIPSDTTWSPLQVGRTREAPTRGVYELTYSEDDTTLAVTLQGGGPLLVVPVGAATVVLARGSHWKGRRA